MDTKQYLVLAALAIVAVVAGMALYLPTGWRNSNWRVLLYSSIGAALAVSIGCFLVARLFRAWCRKIFLGVTSLLIGIATFHALAQHQSYFDYAQRQQNILAGIIARAPHLEPGTTVLLVDRTPPAVFKAWSMCSAVSPCLEAALRYIYADHSLTALYCAPDYRPRGQFSEECRFEGDKVTVSYLYPGSKKRMLSFSPYSSLVVFENSAHGINVVNDIGVDGPDSAANAYKPARRIDVSSPVPRRAHTVFTRWPFELADPRLKQDDLGSATCSPLC